MKSTVIFRSTLPSIISDAIENESFQQAEYNKAFALMEPLTATPSAAHNSRSVSGV